MRIRPIIIIVVIIISSSSSCIIICITIWCYFPKYRLRNELSNILCTFQSRLLEEPPGNL